MTPEDVTATPNADLKAENAKLRAECERLLGISERANKSMEKHMKHNAALEIAIQEAHRDTDTANLQIDELKKERVAYSKHYEKLADALQDERDAALRLNERLQKIVGAADIYVMGGPKMGENLKALESIVFEYRQKRKQETQGSREREDGLHDNLC